jgi:hypothetical protein
MQSPHEPAAPARRARKSLRSTAATLSRLLPATISRLPDAVLAVVVASGDMSARSAVAQLNQHFRSVTRRPESSPHYVDLDQGDPRARVECTAYPTGALRPRKLRIMSTQLAARVQPTQLVVLTHLIAGGWYGNLIVPNLVSLHIDTGYDLAPTGTATSSDMGTGQWPPGADARVVIACVYRART